MLLKCIDSYASCASVSYFFMRNTKIANFDNHIWKDYLSHRLQNFPKHSTEASLPRNPERFDEISSNSKYCMWLSITFSFRIKFMEKFKYCKFFRLSNTFRDSNLMSLLARSRTMSYEQFPNSSSFTSADSEVLSWLYERNNLPIYWQLYLKKF